MVDGVDALSMYSYVGNLDPGVTEELLATLFSQLGSCKGCKIIHEVFISTRGLNLVFSLLVLGLLLPFIIVVIIIRRTCAVLTQTSSKRLSQRCWMTSVLGRDD